MNRRDAINRVALIMGGAVIGADYFLSGCKPANTRVDDLFDADHVAFLNEVADTILPTTSSPGAKAANVGQFIAVMVRDCYLPQDQKVFMEGLKKLDEAAQKQAGGKFMDITPEKRTEVLVALDAEQKAYTAQRNKAVSVEVLQHKNDADYEGPAMRNHYFRMMKELTLLGYFTSEIGATKALRYIAVPGRYDGCVPYKKGDKAWAT
jgi:hypothetical protein